MRLRQKYDKLLEALELIGSYSYCDCDCPNKRQGRIIGKPGITWGIANTALKNVGHKIKVYDEDLHNRQSS